MKSFIAQHLRGVSRTYAIVIPMLPRPLDETVGLAYLLMRIVDTLEDATTLDDDRRRDALRALDAYLEDIASGATPPDLPLEADVPAERGLMAESAEVLRRLAALEPAYRDPAARCARTMIGGVLVMLDRAAARNAAYPAIRTAAEMREYCYYVAGVVGEMLCEMMAHYLRQPALLSLRNLAVELGVGLQLVNILKDCLKDAREGRRYLPAGDDGLVARREIYRAVLEEARVSLARGTEFVLALPSNAAGLRSFCGLPIAWGAMTLARAEREFREIKIRRSAIHSSIARFRQLASDDSALRAWLDGMLRPARVYG